MGLMFVLIFWGCAGLILAIVGALLSRGITSRLIRCARGGPLELLRKRAIKKSHALAVCMSGTGWIGLHLPGIHQCKLFPPRYWIGRFMVLPVTQRLFAPHDRCYGSWREREMHPRRRGASSSHELSQQFTGTCRMVYRSSHRNK